MFRYSACLFAVMLTIFAEPILIVPQAQGAGCGRSICAPTYSYNYNRVVEIEQDIIAIPLVFFQYVQPVAVQTAVGTLSATTGGTPSLAKPVETEDKRIERLVNERVEAIFRRMATGDDDGPPTVVADNGSTVSLPPARDLSSQAKSILQNRCASCHTGPRGKNGVQLFAANGQYAPNVSKATILLNVNSGHMPPAAKDNVNSLHAVPSVERNVLQQWLP